ncbi:Mis12-Mtw1 protein family-domain-containing protein [Phanerochaete sordida]|uniref:Mis12-Mtw1 protein family-domain-containing protein n=1 Tax=Phanerochaete sordida TaxID=48140 RepID=A0A9P3G806_9APHY|nr:Mis12-Mtw1 protein family-domain-containing protein [Phanerochaete sordida]
MHPSHSGPPTSKRKETDGGNPLNQVVKKARKESSAQSSAAAKRKLIGEEKPGGLVIVRAGSARPPHSQDAAPTRSEPQPLPRHSSVPPPSRTTSNGDLNGAHSAHPSKKFKADAGPASSSNKGKGREVLGAVAEADEDEDVRQMQSETDMLRRKSLAAAAAASSDPRFQFPAPGTSSRTTKPPSQPRGRIREMSQPLPSQETPQQERNKLLRGQTDHRRKSSLTRGKRISSTYQSTGVIAQPHTSVRNSSFYKHIDVELPEPQRAAQLLIWCSHRAMNELADEITQAASTSKQGSKDAGKDPPPLSEGDLQLLRGVGEDLVRMLAERKIDTNVYSEAGEEDEPRQLKPNEQNVRNREREVKFNAHIQRLKQEDEAWVEVGASYNSFRSAVLAELEDRKKEFPSAKAKGKRPATAADIALWDISEKDLPDHLRGRDGLALARSFVDAGAETQSPLRKRMDDLQETADWVRTLAHSALESTRLAEADLNQRFSLLSIALSSRIQPGALSNASTLASYLPPTASRPPPTADPQAVLRAMSRVDAERPQTQVGDAARRAARELQRAHDSSNGITERRLTGVPPPTPRKPPGTPRRATTPARGR